MPLKLTVQLSQAGQNYFHMPRSPDAPTVYRPSRSTTAIEITSVRGSVGALHLFEAFHTPTATSTTPTAVPAATLMMRVLLLKPKPKAWR
eukprot:2581056-Rhodomonas_salina.1